MVLLKLYTINISWLRYFQVKTYINEDPEMLIVREVNISVGEKARHVEYTPRLWAIAL